MSTLLLLASEGSGRGDNPSGPGGFLILLGVVVVAVLVVGAVVYGLGRTTRREEREGNVNPADDPRRRSPRA
ncbi:MAG TPA: hypothetical protein VEX39_01610 [Thermoleophilaceae bacterium]|nr:hypothetical protein [Thermoleophilaceae bacterium]